MKDREFHCSGVMVDTWFVQDGQNPTLVRDVPVEEIIRIDEAGGFKNIDHYFIPSPVPESLLNGTSEVKDIWVPIAKPKEEYKP